MHGNDNNKFNHIVIFLFRSIILDDHIDDILIGTFDTYVNTGVMFIYRNTPIGNENQNCTSKTLIFIHINSMIEAHNVNLENT